MSDERRVSVERREHVLWVGLQRPDKRNALDVAMLHQLAQAYTDYEADDEARCMVLFGHGDDFTAGLDLAQVAPSLQGEGGRLFPEGLVDPFGLHGDKRSKPVICAVRGWCLTAGIELILASDICVAADDTRFGQIEINRGIFPFGGATIRMPRYCGWGNAMYHLLTGDIFDAHEAHRMGLVQEIAPVDGLLERAGELAETVASRAPLGVRATLESAWITSEQGAEAAAQALYGQLAKLMVSEDAAEGMMSFIERREAKFKGT